MVIPGRFRAHAAVVLLLTLVSTATAKYSGGSGTAQDPYQIATAADLILLGESPQDYDKHFVMTADIDLDPKLPGRKVFGKAVIAPAKTKYFEGTSFTGVFDGNSHRISHLTIAGEGYLGLFGRLASTEEVRNLGVVDVNIAGLGDFVGALVGLNYGPVTKCYSTGAVKGTNCVGGLVGSNEWSDVTQCYSTGVVSGSWDVGGLVGRNVYSSDHHYVAECYSTAMVNGSGDVGGLVGRNEDGVIRCYSAGVVSGSSYIGGLVGWNFGPGGTGTVTACFWDAETSGQTTSAGGTGKTTAEMQKAKTFLDAGWDFGGEMRNGTSEIWQMPEEGGYPVLAPFNGYTPPLLQGSGTPDDPYVISDAQELGAMVHYSSKAHYRLVASIDLAGVRWGMAVMPCFAGTFDGNDHTISHLTIRGGRFLGLFGRLASGAVVKNLGVVDVNIASSSDCVGGLVGRNGNWATAGVIVTGCYSSGLVSGSSGVGGLVGANHGDVTQSHSTAAVSGNSSVGGLAGANLRGYPLGALCANVADCYSAGVVRGGSTAGGLVGYNVGDVTQSYSVSVVSGESDVGGLIGQNDLIHILPGYRFGRVSDCYSTGAVSGTECVAGLIGRNGGDVSHCYSTGAVGGSGGLVGGLVGCGSYWVDSDSGGLQADGTATGCFWDTQTLGQAKSAGGTGKTTAEMQTARTFLDAGWDFAGETKNGTADIWWILEGKDYPRLWWEAAKK